MKHIKKLKELFCKEEILAQDVDPGSGTERKFLHMNSADTLAKIAKEYFKGKQK